MVRSQQPWDLGEPELNERGQPVIHNIASKLGCIRPNSDMDLPVHSIFPEDEAGLSELARQLEEQQQNESGIIATSDGSSNNHGRIGIKQEAESICCGRTERASSSELDHSDFEHDYRRSAFGGARGGAGSALTMSPASLNYPDFDINTNSATSSDGFSTQSSAGSISTPSLPAYSSPWMTQQTYTAAAQQQSYLSSNGPPSFLDMDMLNQGLLESSFGTIKPHVLNCPNPEVMMGMGDPMMYSGYDADTLRL